MDLRVSRNLVLGWVCCQTGLHCSTVWRLPFLFLPFFLFSFRFMRNKYFGTVEDDLVYILLSAVYKRAGPPWPRI